jgi:predicted RNase H-like nuclease
VKAVSIAGIDLSGPSNPRGTCVVVLHCEENSAVFTQHLPVAGDPEIFALITELARNTSVVVGLDAPLSYQPGGDSVSAIGHFGNAL